MKQYVLDEPGLRGMNRALDVPTAGRGRRAWLLLPAAVAAVPIAVYVMAMLTHETRPIAPPAAPVRVARVAVAAPELPRAVAVVRAPPPQETPPQEPPPSRATRARGRYVIDLHALAIGPAVAMLSEATGATVTGSDVVSASPRRITASFTADSPLEAWKGVFGDVASFAMTCGHSACAVHFVSLMQDRDGSPSMTTLAVRPPTAQTPPPSDEATDPTPDN